ncbi:MAG: TIR domain-containing protein [Rhodomicrobium sp.]
MPQPPPCGDEGEKGRGSQPQHAPYSRFRRQSYAPPSPAPTHQPHGYEPPQAPPEYFQFVEPDALYAPPPPVCEPARQPPGENLVEDMLASVRNILDAEERKERGLPLVSSPFPVLPLRDVRDDLFTREPAAPSGYEQNPHGRQGGYRPETYESTPARAPMMQPSAPRREEQEYYHREAPPAAPNYERGFAARIAAQETQASRFFLPEDQPQQRPMQTERGYPPQAPQAPMDRGYAPPHPYNPSGYDTAGAPQGYERDRFDPRFEPQESWPSEEQDIHSEYAGGVHPPLAAHEDELKEDFFPAEDDFEQDDSPVTPKRISWTAIAKRILRFSSATKKVFISYRRADTELIVGRIHERLTRKFGRDAVFMDIDSIPPGVDFHKYIDDTVARADAVLVLMGRNWLTVADDQGQPRLNNPNDFVRIEIEMALKRNVPVIPVLIGKAEPPEAGKLPESLRPLLRRNAARVDPVQDFDHHMGRLISVLQNHLDGKAAP